MKSVMEVYDELPCEEKIDVLIEALDYMEQYNGRTKYDCIALALGVEMKSEEDEDDSYYE